MANFNGELFRLFAAMPPPLAAKAGRRPVYVFLAFRRAGFNTAGSAGINFTTLFPPPKSPLRAAPVCETGRIGLQNGPFWNAKRHVSGAKTARFKRRFPSRNHVSGLFPAKKRWRFIAQFGLRGIYVPLSQPLTAAHPFWRYLRKAAAPAQDVRIMEAMPGAFLTLRRPAATPPQAPKSRAILN